MSPSLSRTRRSTLSSSLGLGAKLLASHEERRFAREIEDGLEQVEAGLVEETAFADDIADATSRYLLQAGGKRVRPVLNLLTAQLGRGITPEVIRSAQVVEITHLASLYHDDVMDEAQLRRGVPAAQSVWGNSVAILTGDLLFARASILIADLGDDAIRLQAQTFQRLVLGQLHETIGPREGEDPIDHYLGVLADKTGSLLSTAAKSGVIYSDAPVEFREPLAQFGERIGVAFQIVDDVIDLSPNADETGKAAGTDLKSGVNTLPLLYLRRDAETDPAAAELLGRIEQASAEDADDAVFGRLVAEVRAHDVTARTIAEAERWAASAVQALEVLPDGPVKKSLTRFARSVVERHG